MATKAKVISFDGVCNLCNGFVDFVLKRKPGVFYFASLQSDFGIRLKEKHHLNRIDSVVFYQEGEVFVKSEAVLKILAHFAFPWKIFALFKVLPQFFRDWVYDLVAKHRYQLFGRRETCRLPSEDERQWFLD
ncbi:DUF393 domain-containing protein [bacterium]|nr:DUF393 domain-containing protein [bacterium]